MQNIFINVIRNLQLYSAKFLGYYIVDQAKIKLICRFTAFIIR